MALKEGNLRSSLRNVSVGFAIPDSAKYRWVATDYDTTGNNWTDTINNITLDGTGTTLDSGFASDVVVFDGADDFLSNTNATATHGRYAVIMVAKSTDSSADGMMWGETQDGTHFFRHDGPDTAFEYNTNTGEIIAGSSPDANPHIHTVLAPNFTGSESIRIDGTEVASGDIQNSDLDGFIIGARALEDINMPMECAEILIYQDPTEQEILDEEQRLSNEYGIAI